jgi:membrane protein DedA with SNARE-associated domain
VSLCAWYRAKVFQQLINWILQLPFGLAALFLTLVATVRAQTTYWLGRAVAAGLGRTRLGGWLERDAVVRARAALERWGWPIIPLSFLTIGFQTAVNFSAGAVGWRWWRYSLAALPGYVMWGCVYAAGGLAAIGALARFPLLVGAVLGLGLIGGLLWYRRRRRSQ